MLELKIVVPLENHFETEMLSVLLHYIGKTVPTNAGTIVLPLENHFETKRLSFQSCCLTLFEAENTLARLRLPMPGSQSLLLLVLELLDL